MFRKADNKFFQISQEISESDFESKYNSDDDYVSDEYDIEVDYQKVANLT